MKKILLFLSIFFLIISCKKSKEENLKNEIENEITTNLNDPSSYEFNYFHLDSVEYIVHKEIVAENLKEIDNLQNQKNKRLEKRIEFLKSQNQFYNLLNKNKYKGIFSFRGNNKFGAKILAEYSFEADSTYKLIYLKDNTGDTIYKDPEILIQENDKFIKDAEKMINESK
ncbi:hypothetical protein [Flavobacterium defluvii]|uniref:Uncharacterized protein n=1 Tax=Flavobacterium defluvii TaxID=370979 RepID=A0A1M5I177_9FLAO|nr:hypothetical protein [Flavobacterium defluvii]SHG21892.1 hypothetical protein SAMN05443663_102221 [Flavobacterium defluvii]